VNIKQIVKSIEKLHGSDRDQAAKHRAYLDFLRQQRREQEKSHD
jgi:hypothetical protein